MGYGWNSATNNNNGYGALGYGYNYGYNNANNYRYNNVGYNCDYPNNNYANGQANSWSTTGNVGAVSGSLSTVNAATNGYDNGG